MISGLAVRLREQSTRASLRRDAMKCVEKGFSPGAVTVDASRLNSAAAEGRPLE
jgi:hypothetical protein